MTTTTEILPTAAELEALLRPLFADLTGYDANALPDTRFYTPEQWNERKERVGHNALLTVTYEGPLYHAINYYESREQQRKLERIETALRERGVYYEFGYAWTMHIYKI